MFDEHEHGKGCFYCLHEVHGRNLPPPPPCSPDCAKRGCAIRLCTLEGGGGRGGGALSRFSTAHMHVRVVQASEIQHHEQKWCWALCSFSSIQYTHCSKAALLFMTLDFPGQNCSYGDMHAATCMYSGMALWAVVPPPPPPVICCHAVHVRMHASMTMK